MVLSPAPALAGPPFLTDDPEPTDHGRWEIYNFVGGARDLGGLGGEAGVDLNYGGAKDLQLTAVLPLAYDQPRGYSLDHVTLGTGVIELAAKYKFLHQTETGEGGEGGGGIDLAVFPRFFVSTDRRFGSGHVSLLLPVWAEKDFGPWSVFGGGGYTINPGAGNRDFWQGGVTVQRAVGKSFALGAEVFGQSADADDGGGFTALNFGATIKLVEHWSLLASAGPTWSPAGDHGSVFYLSLKADY